MEARPARGLLEILQQVPDPRGRKGRRHTLVAMLATVVCATLCGFQSLRVIQQWLALHQVPMWHLLGFTRKPPKRQAFSKLLARVDDTVLERVLLEFVEEVNLGVEESKAGDEPLTVEAWDGKTLRGTREGKDRAQQGLVRMRLALKRVLSSESHGRIEKRTLATTTNIIDSGHLDWPGAGQLIRLERETKIGGKTRQSVTYAITSLTRAEANAGFLLAAMRGRWSIENSCFYVLDTALGEDRSRVRKGNSARACAAIRHAILNFCRRLGQTVSATLREHAVKPAVLLSRLCIYKQ